VPGHDIIVIGASAGGVEAVSALAKAFPAELDAAVFIVLHFPANGTSVLPAILNRRGKLSAAHARDGESVGRGRIYVAPPDHHMLVRDGRIELSKGPRENGARPSIDPLFRSAARAYGPRVIGVILSGTLDDGTAGLALVKRRGGVAVVQSPEDALFPGMPLSAIENVAVDDVLPLAEMGSRLVELVKRPAPLLADRGDTEGDEMQESRDDPSRGPNDDTDADGNKLWPGDAGGSGNGGGDLRRMQHHDRHSGQPSVFTCPECHGTLWQVEERELMRFRCRVGHAYSSETLLAEQGTSLEAALWTALRALEESAALARRLAQRASERGQRRTAERFAQQSTATETRASIVRNALLLKSAADASGGDTTATSSAVES